jgi:transcriptional regulator with PAS, ATPase and Fis domain
LACGLSQGNAIQEDDIHFMRGIGELVDKVTDNPVPNTTSPQQTAMQGMNAVERYEAGFIASLIDKYQGNRKLMAAEMNISERTLYRKLNRLNLN